MRVMIDDPEPCKKCGKPAATVLVNGQERRLCRDHLPLPADAERSEPESGGQGGEALWPSAQSALSAAHAVEGLHMAPAVKQKH